MEFHPKNNPGTKGHRRLIAAVAPVISGIFEERGAEARTPKTRFEEVRGIALSGAPDEDIAAHFEIPVDELRRRFATVIAKARADYRISIRKKQLQVAMDGNASLLIFLGKHELGQTERVVEQNVHGFPEPWMDPKMG